MLQRGKARLRRAALSGDRSYCHASLSTPFQTSSASKTTVQASDFRIITAIILLDVLIFRIFYRNLHVFMAELRQGEVY